MKKLEKLGLTVENLYAAMDVFIDFQLDPTGTYWVNESRESSVDLRRAVETAVKLIRAELKRVKRSKKDD